MGEGCSNAGGVANLQSSTPDTNIGIEMGTQGVYYQPNKVLDFKTRKVGLNSWLLQNYMIKDDKIKVALNLSVLL